MSDTIGASQQNIGSQEAIFRESYRRLLHWVRSRVVGEKDLGQLLVLAEFYGALCRHNFDGSYHDSDLERIVEERVIQSSNLRLPEFTREGGETVLIATNLYESGGHSRVVLNWMKAFKEEAQHSILIARAVASGYKQALVDQGIPYHLCANRGVALINEIIAYCATAERIVLHIHPEDIITAIAARILAKSGKPIIFYNHADHLFSFGISSASVVCEISTYGTALNERTNRARQQSFVGIPIDFQRGHLKSPELPANEHEKIVLSGGSPYKYVPADVSFSDLIDIVLDKRDDVTFMLVGPTGKEPWWARAKTRWGDRLHFTGKMLSYSQYIELLLKADVYVDSFPVCGGTAFPEALLHGKLVTGVRTPIHGYSPADETKVGDVQEAAKVVLRLLDREATTMSRVEQAREHATDIHSMTRFRERVKNTYAGVYDKGPHSAVKTDTHWFEKRWEASNTVVMPGQWFRLPIEFCIAFRLTFARLFRYSQPNIRGYLSKRLFLSPLAIIFQHIRCFMKCEE